MRRRRGQVRVLGRLDIPARGGGVGRVGLHIELCGESRKGFSRSAIYILKISDCSEENGFRGTKVGVERPWDVPRFIRRGVAGWWWG